MHSNAEAYPSQLSSDTCLSTTISTRQSLRRANRCGPGIPSSLACSSPRRGVLCRQHGLEGNKFGRQAAGIEHALYAKPHWKYFALEFDTVEEETIPR